MPEINYGQDLSATTGLDVTMRLVSGTELMGQVVLHRLYCPKGGLIGAPAEELLDVRELLGVGQTRATIARQEALCAAAVEGDERVSSATVTIVPVGPEEMTVRAVGQGSLGPFDLLLSVTRASAQVLSGGDQ